MKSRTAIALTLAASFALVATVAEAAPRASTPAHAAQTAQQKKPSTKSGKRPRKAPAKAPASAPVVEEAPIVETTTPAPDVETQAPLKADGDVGAKAVVPFAAADADVAPAHESRPGARPGGIGGAFVVAALGFDIGGRTLAYNDRLTSNLRTYDVLGAPSLGGSVELYPFAASTTPVVRDLGLVGGYRQAFGLSSRTEAGDEVKTAWNRLDVGLRIRGRVGSDGDRPIAVVGASIGYKREAFTFDGSAAIQKEMPSVTYSCLKLGGDVRIPVGPLAITAAAAFLPVFSSGAVAARLRESTVGAVEGEIGVAVPFGKSFEGRLGASYTRYFYAFHPQPGDVYVAGGALDQIVRGQTALAFLY